VLQVPQFRLSDQLASTTSLAHDLLSGWDRDSCGMRGVPVVIPLWQHLMGLQLCMRVVAPLYGCP
jgi:hypothetical protein